MAESPQALTAYTGGGAASGCLRQVESGARNAAARIKWKKQRGLVFARVSMAGVTPTKRLE
jgi:hypothetical protein